MITSFKTALSAPDVPVISGQLGPFLKDFEKTVHYQSVNQQLRDLQQHVDNYASVSADGLSCIGDNLHFNTASLREFGERYAKQFLKMQTN